MGILQQKADIHEMADLYDDLTFRTLDS